MVKKYWISNRDWFFGLQFFLKKNSTSGSGVANNEIKQNLQLAKELHKPIIRTFINRTVYSRLKDNIWGDVLADM